MKNILRATAWLFLSLFFLVAFSCNTQPRVPSNELISSINLKRGAVISCGPSDSQLGTLEFETSCGEKVKADFNLAIKLLHSFEYDEAEKVFAKIIDVAPGCALAYWGVAMSNFHPLWTPPSIQELEKGTKAIEIAKSLVKPSTIEEAYIDAVAAFYRDYKNVDHLTRCLNFEHAMEQLVARFPNNREAKIFYALALTAAANPADKTFAKQKKAGTILNGLFPGEPNHPGIIHYLIHTYDSPELAELALPAARKYAAVAASSSHALHMPSHIFTRLGLWNESIQSNLASMASAQCYAESAGIKGHWDEELHAMDYLVYAYLQKGDNELAKKQWDYLNTMELVSPVNFKVAYAFAAIPSRYLLENKNWAAAASLDFLKIIPWENFHWQKAIVHFTRLMGAVHTGKMDAANVELIALEKINKHLLEQKDIYKSNLVMVQIKTAEAWMKFREGNNREAVALMQLAADIEDKTEKHPVTPGAVIPARELLADLFMQLNQFGPALEAYELGLKKNPNRFNAVYGAALAAEKGRDFVKADTYYRQLLNITNSTGVHRPEIETARLFLKRNNLGPA